MEDCLASFQRTAVASGGTKQNVICQRGASPRVQCSPGRIGEFIGAHSLKVYRWKINLAQPPSNPSQAVHSQYK